MTQTVPIAFVDDLFDILEKSAATADALEQVNIKLATENAELHRRPKVRPAFFSPGILLKVAEHLEREGLLPVGVTNAKQAASLIEENPNRLAELVFSLTPSFPSDGRPVKAAAAVEPISGAPKMVKVGSKELADYDGWEAAIR